MDECFLSCMRVYDISSCRLETLEPLLMCPWPVAIWTVSQVGRIITRSSGTELAFTVDLGYISILTFSVNVGRRAGRWPVSTSPTKQPWPTL